MSTNLFTDPYLFRRLRFEVSTFGCKHDLLYRSRVTAVEIYLNSLVLANDYERYLRDTEGWDS